MDEVTVRELRNHGGRVLERVVRGETFLVTRAGKPVAELRPVARAPRSSAALVASRRGLPHVDVTKLRADIDQVIDQSL